MRSNRWFTPWVLVIPALTWLLVFNLWPSINTVILSFTNAKPIGGGHFVGQLLRLRGACPLRAAEFRPRQQCQSRHQGDTDLHVVPYFHFSRATMRPISLSACKSSSFDIVMGPS